MRVVVDATRRLGFNILATPPDTRTSSSPLRFVGHRELKRSSTKGTRPNLPIEFGGVC